MCDETLFENSQKKTRRWVSGTGIKKGPAELGGGGYIVIFYDIGFNNLSSLLVLFVLVVKYIQTKG